jgi:hypothetical protein
MKEKKYQPYRHKSSPLNSRDEFEELANKWITGEISFSILQKRYRAYEARNKTRPFKIFSKKEIDSSKV